LAWLTGYLLYNIWLPDGLAYLAVVLAAIAALDRRPIAFAAILLVGALAKEQVLLAAPLWYTFGADRLVDRRLLLRTAALALPAAGLLVALRAAIPAGNDDPAYLAQLGLPLNAWDVLPQDPRVLLSLFGPPRLPTYPFAAIDWTIGAFGTLGLLALAAPRANARVALRWSPFLALVYAQPLMASNTKRLVALAFPVAIVMALNGLVALERRLRLHRAVVVAVPLLLLVPDHLSRTNVRFPFEVAGLATLLLLGAAASRGWERARIPGPQVRAPSDADGRWWAPWRAGAAAPSPAA
jgi:hypothetical protein